MPSTEPHLSLETDLRPATLQAVFRDVVVVGIFLLIGALVTVLPGAGRAVPGTSVSLGALLIAGIALAVVVTLALAGASVQALVRALVDGPADVVDDLAVAARYGLVFLAVLVAHQGFGPVVVPLLIPDSVWIYDVAFLGFALFPLVAIAHRLYRNADAVAGSLADAVAGRTEPPGASDGDGVERSGS